MQIKFIKNLKKIIFVLLLIFPNKLYASFFENLTSQIVENPKRLSYGVSVTDVNKDGNFDFVVTGFGYLNLALSYNCLLYTSPSPRDAESSRMPSSA